ncbi:MAG TPA: GAF domain-containing protein [Anaerolineaceae bacterium]|nr:GAF domain-containing protein [Anaerolineaceae bacterium]
MTAPFTTEQSTLPLNSFDGLDLTEPRSKTISRILTVTILSSGLLSLWFTYQAIQVQAWQNYVLAIGAWISTGLSAWVTLRRVRNSTFRVYFVQTSLSAVLILASGLVDNISPFTSAFILGYAILMPSAIGITTINMGIGLALISSLAGIFSPFNQVAANRFQFLLLAGFALLAIMFGILAIRKVIVISMHIKVIIASLIVALIPLIVISIIQSGFMTNSITSTTNQSLEFAAVQTAGKIDEFLNTNRQAIVRDITLSSFIDYLTLSPAQRPGSSAEANLRITIESLQKRPQAYLLSYGLLDASGFNVFDTNPTSVSRFETFGTYFQAPMTTGQIYVSDVEFSSTTGDGLIYFSGPILNRDNKIIGVLRARFDATGLQTMAQENTGLIGSRSYPILIDENTMRLADTLTPENLYKTIVPLSKTEIQRLQDTKRLLLIPANKLYTQMADFAQSLSKIKDQPYFSANLPLDPPIEIAGAVAPLKNKPWRVLYVQEQAILAQLLKQQNRITLLIATVIAGLVSLLATLASQFITQPITNLTKSSERITAGDFDVTVPVADRDEIGTLASAFNLMTSRVRALINELEDRVRARTIELENQNKTLRYRTQQIETVSEVARSIASAQDLEKLLTQITTLISERFGFYHVGVFLLNQARDFAELRAANSEGGQRMLARQHKLKVGQVGIVGFVTATGKPRIALDVGEDAIHFKNPDLPRTRSEMALPLIANGNVIGALDVQSENVNAFSQNDVELFSTLADQVAIAIVNSRLYQETVQALEESQILHRQYLRQEWSKTALDMPIVGYQLNAKGLNPIITLSPLDSEEELQPPEVSATRHDESRPILKVPISLRGEVIGTIELKNEDNSPWDGESEATARAIADQISQALENARLFEQTQRRADRERKVLEITSRIRSVTDPEAMLQIAAEELQNALNASAQIVLISDERQMDEDRNNNNGFHAATDSLKPGLPEIK